MAKDKKPIDTYIQGKKGSGEYTKEKQHLILADSDLPKNSYIANQRTFVGQSPTQDFLCEKAK